MTSTLLALLLLASAASAAVTPTAAPGDDAMDAAFAGQVEAMGGEITAALNELSTAFGPDGTREDYPALRVAGSNLSTRARSWTTPSSRCPCRRVSPARSSRCCSG